MLFNIDKDGTPTPLEPIAFIDLQAQRKHMGEKLEQAILDVVRGGKYVMGPQVADLEKELGKFCYSKHVISCYNGTDALSLGLMAKEVGPGDAVFVPSFTFAATAEVVALRGATPIFVDVNADTFNMDVDSLANAMETVKAEGLKAVGVIAVDLFGQPADYDPIESFCDAYDLWLMADGAQSFGAEYRGRKVGSIGFCATTSFFPAKPLGCYGDGGAVFTGDDLIAEKIKSFRVHGKGTHKYDNTRIGVNARLDTVQAAVLLEKLKIFPKELEDRQEVADRYDVALGDLAKTPRLLEGCTSAWAQYTLTLQSHDRDEVAAKLKEVGVPTAIYYPLPLHQQVAYKNFPVAGGSLAVSEDIAGKVLSLPMHPYMDDDAQDYIITQLRRILSA